jgi:hypothetical protein
VTAKTGAPASAFVLCGSARLPETYRLRTPDSVLV